MTTLEEALLRYDAVVGIGDEVAVDYCDCEMCQAQSRLRQEIEAAKAERA